MSYHVTAEEIQNLDSHKLNQLMIDFLSRVHSKCMHHCLDKDSEEYQIHNAIRDLVGLECQHSALSHQRKVAHATRFDVPLPGWRRRELKIAELRARRQK